MYPDIGFEDKTIVLKVNEVRGATFFSLYFVLCAPTNYHFARTFGASAYMMTYVALFSIKCILFALVVHSCAQMKQKNNEAKQFHIAQYCTFLNLSFLAEQVVQSKKKTLKYSIKGANVFLTRSASAHALPSQLTKSKGSNRSNSPIKLMLSNDKRGQTI